MPQTPENTQHPFRVFAVVGKGGVGKTTFAFFFARALIARGRHPLLIDADPALSHLARALGVLPERTMESIRADLIHVASHGTSEEKTKAAHDVDAVVARSVIKGPDYDLLVMGQPTSAGCFCPSNTLLRSVIRQLINQYDAIIIDCEAGLEQVHRQVISAVDYLVVVTDPSARSITTAEAIIASSQRFTQYKRAGLVVNKVTRGTTIHLPEWVEKQGIDVLGQLPEEPSLQEHESTSLSLVGNRAFVPLQSAVESMVEKIDGSTGK
nr:AAA family ATPase [Candidatus Sigynarchaeota archaeon]